MTWTTSRVRWGKCWSRSARSRPTSKSSAQTLHQTAHQSLRMPAQTSEVLHNPRLHAAHQFITRVLSHASMEFKAFNQDRLYQGHILVLPRGTRPWGKRRGHLCLITTSRIIGDLSCSSFCLRHVV